MQQCFCGVIETFDNKQLVYNISLLDLIFAAIIFGLQLLQSSPIVIICGYLCKYCDHL